MMSSVPTEAPFVVARVATVLVALPIHVIVEVIRPLHIEPLGSAPEWVLGLARVRGRTLPVVDCACLLGRPPTASHRWLVLHVGERFVVLAVDDVLGLRTLPNRELVALPPLLHGAAGASVQMLSSLDEQLVLVLEQARLVPADSTSAEEQTR